LITTTDDPLAALCPFCKEGLPEYADGAFRHGSELCADPEQAFVQLQHKWMVRGASEALWILRTGK